MDTKVGQQSRQHIKVGQMNHGNHKLGAKVQGNKSGGIRHEPSQQQKQDTTSQYNKYK